MLLKGILRFDIKVSYRIVSVQEYGPLSSANVSSSKRLLLTEVSELVTSCSKLSVYPAAVF